jgi:hypothetical protein
MGWIDSKKVWKRVTIVLAVIGIPVAFVSLFFAIYPNTLGIFGIVLCALSWFGYCTYAGICREEKQKACCKGKDSCDYNCSCRE